MTDREKFIVLSDSDRIVRSDVIILLEGDGFSRLKKCAELFHAQYAPLICFSGGADNAAYGSFPFHQFREKLSEYNLTENDFMIEGRSQHTQAQAMEIVKLAQEQRWKKIILVASNFHQYRAYLTFLKALQESKLELAIINAPAADLPWFEEQPWGQRFSLLEGEFEKIEKYMALGHCATYKEAIDYQKWKEQWIPGQ